MAAVDRTNNTEQLQRFINNLCQHQQKNEFCDFTLTTNNTSIECHKLVLSSASSYFYQLLCDSEYNINIFDVTPLPEYILRTVVAFMYNSEYIIDDDNVIELLKLSITWNLDILIKLCVEYMTDNITINNACRFYNFALDKVDQHKSRIINEFIREHFTSLHESGQLRKLSLKNFINIIAHDEINVKNEDVIFSSAVQIINQRTPVEDINRCLDLIRFPHTSGDFLVNVVLDHQLMKEPPRDKYLREALLYQVNKRSTPEVKPPRYWGKSGIYYYGKDHSFYQYISTGSNNECVKKMRIPAWVDKSCSVVSHRESVIFMGFLSGDIDDTRALLFDMTEKHRKTNTKITYVPDLPERRHWTGAIMSDNVVYVVGGSKNCKNSACVSSFYHLSLGSNKWQTKRSMPHAVKCPLVVKHQQSIYVLGGENEDGEQKSYVSQYNMENDTWKQCSDMPVACDREDAGVVVHEGRIKVVTVDKCLVYDDDTDTWTVKQYNKLGDAINAFVLGEQICAAVQNGDTFSMMSYDDVDNVWKTEREKIDNAFCTRFFF